ncbi:hydantoinase/oxoprolinase family protein [Methylocystis sp. 9N]|uniref:Hydantoinase/oxoprolinase family protein n=1 Tax=Methylocystis borbori TaxID=3118750 RepID=A0ABU7XE07_9HYPH
MTAIIGWDIGGAHVKAARAQDGRLTGIVQIACAPHEGLASLERAIRDARERLGPAERHRVTMTAELSDAFENRAKGVLAVAAIAAREIGADDILFYAGARGFVARAEAADAALAIASANWRVSAELAAQNCAEALFLDMGSTTTDLIPIRDGRIVAHGASDAERLACGELVYAGFARGAPQAYAARAPINGQWIPLVNEAFATMADVRRALGDLPEGEGGADLSPTADGRPKTIAASRARLARLAGRDAGALSDDQWRAFADFLARAQLRVIEDQIALLFSRGAVASDAALIGAGVGRKLIARLAQAQGRVFIDFADFIAAEPQVKEKAADCAPATALALLAA